jgi:hypothetical protein
MEELMNTLSFVRQLEIASNVHQRQGIGKDELDRMVDMLDDEEIEIAIDYLSQLLLSRAKIDNEHQLFSHVPGR